MMEDLSDRFRTATEADLDACYGGRFYSALDLGDRKIRTKIADVRVEELPRLGGKTQKRLILRLTTIDKEVVLNSTNKNAIVSVLGKNPADWIGAEIGLWTEPTMYAGKPTRGLRLRVLNKPTAPPPKQVPARTLASSATAEPPWPEQLSDPGRDLIDIDRAAE